MKNFRFPLTVLLVVISIGVFGETKVPAKGIVIAPNGLRFRTGPGTQYPIIKTLPEGSEVQIIDFSSRWYKIRVSQQDGYCFARYIRVTEHSPAAEDNASRIPHVTLSETDPLNPALNAHDPKILHSD